MSRQNTTTLNCGMKKRVRPFTLFQSTVAAAEALDDLSARRRAGEQITLGELNWLEAEMRNCPASLNGRRGKCSTKRFDKRPSPDGHGAAYLAGVFGGRACTGWSVPTQASVVNDGTTAPLWWRIGSCEPGFGSSALGALLRRQRLFLWRCRPLCLMVAMSEAKTREEALEHEQRAARQLPFLGVKRTQRGLRQYVCL